MKGGLLVFIIKAVASGGAGSRGATATAPTTRSRTGVASPTTRGRNTTANNSTRGLSKDRPNYNADGSVTVWDGNRFLTVGGRSNTDQSYYRAYGRTSNGSDILFD